MSTVLLVCQRNPSHQVSVDARQTVEGQPVVEWFIQRRQRLCTSCYDAVRVDTTQVRRNARDTSRAAALSAAPRAGTKRALVLQAIVDMGGLTDEEMQKIIPMSPNTQRPRRVELVTGGFIKDSGQRRKTSTGDMAIVWERT